MRVLHRTVAIFAVLFAVYMAATGVTTQIMDLRALHAGAPANDPTMQGIRAGVNGPPNFQVIRDPDYSALELPAGLDYGRALATVIDGYRAAFGPAPASYVELRMSDGRPIGHVASGELIYRIDAATGLVSAPIAADRLLSVSQPSARNTVKTFHSMVAFGWGAVAIALMTAVALAVMIVTGTIVYIQLFKVRARQGRRAPFWVAGGWWRTLHRAIGAVAALFLTVVVLSGGFLAVNSLGININKTLNGGRRPGLTADVSSPLSEAQLQAMLGATLKAYRAGDPDRAIRVLRLRYFADMPQGIVITGGRDARQLVFNTTTGRPAGMSGAGYPRTGMPFGWDAGQLAKRIHRGDILGLPGRWMDLLTGLSLLYISVSGAVVYLDLWKRRRKMGRGSGLFWS